MKGKLLAGALLSGISLSMSVGLLATSAWLISMASTRPPAATLKVAIVAVCFFGLGRGVIRYLGRLLEHSAALAFQSSLRVKIYQGLEARLPSSFFGSKRGSYLQRMANESEQVLDLWLRLASPLLAAVISGAVGIGIGYLLDPTIGYYFAALFLAAVLLVPLIAAFTGESATRAASEEVLVERFVATLDELDESIIFGKSAQIEKELGAITAELDSIDFRGSTWAGTADAVLALLMGAAVIVGLLNSDNVALVNVAVVILLPLAIFDGLTGLGAAFTSLPGLVTSWRRLKAMPLAEASQRKFSSVMSVRDLVPENVAGRLLPISFDVKRGELLSISGASGVGKSSLLHALVGFIGCTGTLPQLTPANSSVLLQSDHLFMMSIAENLKIGKLDATEEELWHVLADVELAELVRSLPGGIDTHVGSMGYNFSGGEQQRLKLARLFLRESDIYLLDEPFEYLDEAQGKRIAARMLSRFQGGATVITSHLPISGATQKLILRAITQ